MQARTRVLLAVASVLCAVATGVLTNLATDRWSVIMTVGLLTAVACWTTVEVVRARREPAPAAGAEPASAAVTQSAGTVLGRLVGVRRARAAGPVTVRQTVEIVGSAGEVVGYDDSRPPPQSSATPGSRRPEQR
ncbi:hypothetical protein [Micromonospora sp. ATCC 39149]|uniref:Uncharacterized protein n=1 Tax=Micromonospora carbonacea TaxID=47853 RepID=A0A7D5Y4Z5_9ACTN|nr:hypothetical protein [Micromonospora sp. ATCC 39149]QLJ96918.1 hypothetical protein HZU44_18750 [Micromonospora carbonacea]